MFAFILHERAVAIRAMFLCSAPSCAIIQQPQGIRNKVMALMMPIVKHEVLLWLVISSGATMDPLRARLEAAHGILEANRDKVSLKAVSRLQRDAVAELLNPRGKPLDAAMRAEISELILKVPWHGEDGNYLLDVLTPTKLPPVKRRRQHQSYESLVEYATPAIWEILKSPGPANLKLHTVINLGIGLGLRCPSEYCAKFLTSWWIYMSESQEELARLAPQQKHTMLQHFKTEFDRARKQQPDPATYLVKLPDTPLQLLRDHEVIYQSFYKDGDEPSKPPVDTSAIWDLDRSYHCRAAANLGQVVSRVQAVQPVEVATVPPPIAGIERVANIFMDRLGSLQNSQQKIAGDGLVCTRCTCVTRD